jgi:hypothetical protein
MPAHIVLAVAQDHGHDCFHVNWLGLSGETDWDLMPRIVAEDFTFVTNNARDFRKLYARGSACWPGDHRSAGSAGTAVGVVRARSAGTCRLDLVNEVVEIAIEEGEALLTRHALPA